MPRQGLVGVVAFAVVSLMLVRLPPMVAEQDSVLNTFRTLVEVDALTKQRYVAPIANAHLVDGAIRGMLMELDPYSGYIAPEALAAFFRRSRGEYVGIGIEVGMEGRSVTVIAPVDQSPAAHAGILAGDVILAIDGVPTSDLSVFDVNELLSGPPDSAVVLRIRHSGESKPTEIKINRGPVSLTTVRGYRRDGHGAWDFRIDPEHGVAYFRISSFHDNTVDDFRRALQSIDPRDRRAIVLDLRFNPGGLMDQAVALVDQFVASGLILSTVTRRHAVQEYYATPEHTLQDPALAVLVNSGSASSSEIVAGSLQDHRRATIIGTRTFGKGSAQRLIELATIKAAIKLTIAYYRLPSGRIIHRTHKSTPDDPWGVWPDIVVTLDDEETRRIQHVRRQLDNHVYPLPDAAGARGVAPAEEILRDRQLQAALDWVQSELARRDAPASTNMANRD